MVTEVAKAAFFEYTSEELLEDQKQYEAELYAIERAIAAGVLKDGFEGPLSEKKIAKIRDLVHTALDALPWGHGVQRLTPAELEFAEKFAWTLAGDMRSKK